MAKAGTRYRFFGAFLTTILMFQALGTTPVHAISDDLNPTDYSTLQAPISPTVNEVKLNSIQISWVAPTIESEPVLDYELRMTNYENAIYLDRGDIHWTDFSDGISTSTTMEVTNVARDQQYIFQIRAIYQSGNSNWVGIRYGNLANVVKLSEHGNCAILNAGAAYCWQSGNSIPKQLAGEFNMNAISGNGNDGCGILTNGSVVCWGIFNEGHASYPKLIPSLQSVIKISVGLAHACAILSNGVVKCWGNNEYGQLGNGTLVNSKSPVSASGITDATDIAADVYSTCVVRTNKTVSCWGSNSFGQLGDGSTETRTSPIRTQVVDNASTISITANTACSLLLDKTVKCWGYNGEGEVGDGTSVDRWLPTAVQNINNAKQISGHCALLESELVKCWGNNRQGRLGIGTVSNPSLTPVVVHDLQTVMEIGGNDSASCARLTGGLIKCWGNTSVGIQTVPTAVGQVTSYQISAGGLNTCALLDGNSVSCFGDNSSGQLGDGTQTSNAMSRVSGISDAIQISTGTSHSCALLLDNQISCWGNNENGQLGNDTTTNSSLPSPVRIDEPVRKLASGGAHTCALLASGGVKCWGLNINGQLGDGTTTTRRLPVDALNIRDAIDVYAYSNTTCIIKSNHTTQCWGLRTFASQRPPAFDVAKLSLGQEHSCAVMMDASLDCWGNNGFGQLGDAGLGRSEPQSVPGLGGIVDVVVFDNSTCALNREGIIYCWGKLWDKPWRTNTPTRIQGKFGQSYRATSLTAGERHFCALSIDGNLNCWGRNLRGEIGARNWDSWFTSGQPIQSFVDNIPYISLKRSPTFPSTSDVIQLVRANESISLEWPISNSDSLLSDKYKVEWSLDEQTWNTKEVASNSIVITGLKPATNYRFRISPHSLSGWSDPSDTFNAVTSGSRTMRFRFTTSDNKPLSGGQVSWESRDGTFSSAAKYGVTENGVLDFPRVVAGPGVVTVSNLRLPNGDFVSGLWNTQLGSSITNLILPEIPTSTEFKIQVRLPNGMPISGAQIQLNTLETQASIGDFRFDVYRENQGEVGQYITDSKGEVSFKGYRFYSTPTATISYSDGVLRQTKIRALDQNSVAVQFDEMPWLDLPIDSTLANENSLVAIPVTLHNPDNNARLHERNVATSSSLPTATVKVTPPSGAQQSCKNRVLSAKTNNAGRATLKVCATKSGIYKISGKGATATGDFFLRVKGAPSLPVTSASGTTPALGTAKLSWNPPTYTGGAPITGYKVTISGGGKTTSRTVHTKSVTFTSLKSATTYLARIQAITKNGLSDPVTVRIGVA